MKNASLRCSKKWQELATAKISTAIYGKNFHTSTHIPLGFIKKK